MEFELNERSGAERNETKEKKLSQWCIVYYPPLVMKSKLDTFFGISSIEIINPIIEKLIVAN